MVSIRKVLIINIKTQLKLVTNVETNIVYWIDFFR